MKKFQVDIIVSPRRIRGRISITFIDYNHFSRAASIMMIIIYKYIIFFVSIQLDARNEKRYLHLKKKVTIFLLNVNFVLPLNY